MRVSLAGRGAVWSRVLAGLLVACLLTGLAPARTVGARAMVVNGSAGVTDSSVPIVHGAIGDVGGRTEAVVAMASNTAGGEPDLRGEGEDGPVRVETQIPVFLDVYGTGKTGDGSEYVSGLAAAKPGEFIICYRDKVAGARKGGSLQTTAPAAGSVQLVRAWPDADPEETIRSLMSDPAVEYIEPNYEMYAQGAPDDPRLDEQWGLAEVEAVRAWDTAAMRLGELSPAEVRVAVIDTGVDPGHEDLSDRVEAGVNVITGADSGDYMDDSANGHGTHVAGIIAASADNAKGIAGVAGTLPVGIVAVKALDSAGVGSMYDVAQGIRWAADNGARVINLSLGARLPDFPRILADAVEYAQDKGVLVVAAAGNEGRYNPDGFYPACLPGVIAASASGPDHRKAEFSNDRGVYAPGVDILSTLPGDGQGESNRYGKASGTSMAAGFLSGTAGLLWSVYPDSTVLDVANALRYGSRKFPDGYSYNYVLSAYESIFKLKADTWSNIVLIRPEDGAHVTGNVQITAEVPYPANVAKVVFCVYPPGDRDAPTLIGEVGGPAEGAGADSGLFHVTWDSAQVDDGIHTITAESFAVDQSDGSYESLATYDIEVIVANQFESGLQISVVKPDGSPASGATVTVHHARRGEDGGIEILDRLNEWESGWEFQADLDGRLTIPGHEALDGNDYFVLARGSEPDFLYCRLVRAPGEVILGPEEERDEGRRVAITGLRTDGKPLGGALILADIQGISIEDRDSLEDFSQIQLTQLRGDGSGEVWLSPGRYDLRLASSLDAYYLKQAVEVGAGAGGVGVEFAPQPAEVGTIHLAADGEHREVGLQLRDEECEAFVGFDMLDGSATVTATPGQYTALVSAVYCDPTYNVQGKEKLWTWRLFVPEFDVAAGADRTISFGGEIGATLDLVPWQEIPIAPGKTAYFVADFPDDHGNLTGRLGWEVVTPAGAGALEAETAPRVVIHTPSRLLAYDPGAGRFELVTEALTDATKTLEILDGDGQPVTQGYPSVTWRRNLSYDDYTGVWYVPSSQSEGDYSARAKIDAGPLGPSASDGMAKSQDCGFAVGRSQALPGGDLSVKVLDMAGAPLRDARVEVLRRAGDVYDFEDLDFWRVGHTDSDGNSHYYGDIDGEGRYALAVSGTSPIPDGSGVKEPFFLLVPISAGTPPLSVTVDLSSLSMRRLRLCPLDKSGDLLFSQSELIAFGYDGEGAAGGSSLESGPGRDGVYVLWVPEGLYTFQINVNASGGGGPAAAWVENSHHLVRQVRVPDDTGGDPEDPDDDGVISLGGTGLAEVSVACSQSGESGAWEYGVGGVALFGPGLPFSQALNVGPDRPVFVSPGQYKAGILLVRDHYDGEWDYWLEGSLDATSGGTIAHQVDDSFTAHITLDAGEYSAGGTVRATIRVEDSSGNRLIAVTRDVLGIHSAGGSAGGEPVEIQDHYRIAPFLVIRDPSGHEICRYKDTGPDFDLLEQTPGGGDNWIVRPSLGQSTFFSAEHLLPENAVSGEYEAQLELGAGPERTMSPVVKFTVEGGGAAPTLSPLPAATNAESVTVTGSATASSLVRVSYRLNGGEPTTAAETTAGGDGGFSVDVVLQREGSYAISAIALVQGVAGPESATVTVVVDRTPPGPPAALAGRGEDQNHIRITWEKSTDQDVATYRVFRRDQLGAQIPLAEVPVGSALTYLDGDLEPQTEYEYSVVAVDRAGNVSEPVSVKAETTAAPDVTPPTAPENLVASYRTGGFADLAWDAATDNIRVDLYHVWRTADGGERIKIGEVEVGASQPEDQPLEYHDSGLAAETAYEYEVTALDPAGNESAPCKATLTTPPMTILVPTWSPAPRLGPNRLLLQGSAVVFSVTGEANRTATVDLTYKCWFDGDGNRLPEPQSVQATVDLSESDTSAGQYSGEFVLPAGTSELTSASAMLSDGTGHTAGPRAAAGLPRPVTGSILVSLVMPEGGYEGTARIVAWSDAVGDGASLVVEGGGSYTLSGLTAGDYRLRLLTSDGHRLAEEPVSVAAGDSTAIAVVASLLATVKARVVDPSGDPVPGVSVSTFNLTGDADRVAAWLMTAADGCTEIVEGCLKDDQIKVKAELIGKSRGLPYKDRVEKTAVLEAGTNTITVQLEPLPGGTLQGVTRDTEGEPLAGIVISAAGQSGERSITTTAVSGQDGSYSLRAPAGKYRVDAASVTHKHLLPRPITGTLAEEESKALDLTLDTLGPGWITFELNTIPLDGPPHKLETWSLIDFHTHDVRVNGARPTSSPMLVYGRPGDTYIVSASTAWSGMPHQTVEVTLDEQREARAVLKAEEQCRITATIVDSEGKPYRLPNGMFLSISAFKQEDGGSMRCLGTPPSMEMAANQFRVSFPSEGQYQLTIREMHMDPNISSGANCRSATIGDISVSAGEIVDLGDVRMQTRSGLFAGLVTSVPSEAAPGATLSLRAEFGLSPNTQETTSYDTKVFLRIPGGTTLIPGSVTLDGAPVNVAVLNSSVCVSLGDVPLKTGERFVVTYRVRVDDDFADTEIAAGAYVEWGLEDQRISDQLVQTVLPLAQVTLNAPARLAQLTPTLWGRAPSERTVLVYDRDILIGQAQASRAGFWYLFATLPDFGKGSKHRLRACVEEHPRGPLHSAEAVAIYDPDQPELIEMTMSQYCGYKVTVDPSLAVARFPFMITDQVPLDFQLRFNDPARVQNVRVYTGSRQGMAQKEADGRFTASINTVGTDQLGRGLGDIHVAYEVRPPVEDLCKPGPTVDELRLRMPPGLENFVVLSSGPLVQGQQAETGAAYVEFKPGEESSITGRVEMTIGKGITTYNPTAPHVALADSSGVPVYGFMMSSTLNPNTVSKTITIDLEGYVPQSLVEEQGAVKAAGLDVVVKIGSKITVTSEQMFNVGDWTKSLVDGFGVPDVFRQLEGLLEESSDCGGSASMYRDQIDSLGAKLMAGEAAKWGMMIAGTLLGPATFGLGTLAIFGASQAMEWAIDREMQQNVADIRQDMADDEECKRDEDGDNTITPSRPPEPKKPGDRDTKAASPVYIWDPSGYVYEAVPENRLEGVTATCLEQDPVTGEWGVWDAAWFGQSNPLITDSMGKYGWDVPEGLWQVMYQKPGYETAYSAELRVLPPHFDVNVGMRSLAAPEVTGVRAASDGSCVDVSFSKYMLASTLADSTVTLDVHGGSADGIAGAVSSLDPLEAGGKMLSRAARFTPDEALTVGEKYDVWVSGVVQSYAEQPMAGDVTRTVTVQPLDEVSGAGVVAGDGMLTIAWTDPAAAGVDKMRLYWRERGAGAYSGPAEVAAGVQGYRLMGLANGVTYEVKIAVLYRSGEESPGVVVTGMPMKPSGGGSGGRRRVEPVPPVQAVPPGERLALGPSAGQVTESNGLVSVQYSEGTFGAGWALYINALEDWPPDGPGGGASAPGGLIPLTPVYEFNLSQGKPEKPVLVTFKYDSSRLGGIDPRGLGVYRQDERDPSKWGYVGGIVDVSNGLVRVWLTGFSRYAVMARDVEFGDMKTHWSRREVGVLAGRGLVQGVGGDEFAPDLPVTRAQLAKMLVMMLMQDRRRGVHFEVPASPSFSDVVPDAWHYPYVETAVKHGIAKGDAGMFRPDDLLTRQEMAVMVIRAMGIEDKAALAEGRKLRFDDAEDMAPWAKGHLGLALFKGIMQGMSPTTLGPSKNATRAQAAVVILRAMERMGLVSALETVSGILRVNEIEGRHYEIETVADGKSTVWVLLPDGGPEGVIGKRLDGVVGKRVDVRGIVETGASVYMRGPVLRVVTVLLPNCPLCDP